jgi:membrane fusion protein (multidrug efflux system)
MFKRMLIMLVLLGLIFGGIFFFISFKERMIKEYMASASNPAQTVSTVKAVYSDWLPAITSVGSVVAFQGVDVSAEVPGLITGIYFKQGNTVEAGTPLLQLRADDERAKLKSLIASREIARITWQRDLAQLKVKAVSQQLVDTDHANWLVATANVAQIEAMLVKKTVSAPFSGVLGVRLVNLGQYLDVGKAIVSLQSLNSVFVDFYVPQQQLANLAVGQKINISSDSYPSKNFNGIVAVINPVIDEKTRNVLIRATVKNPDHKLLPGMYVTINVNLGKPLRLVTVPRTAISFNPYGATIFKIEKSGVDKTGKAVLIVKQSFVTLGEARGDTVAITSGVTEGEEVVSSGQIKLRNGTVININNSVQPSNDVDPNPGDKML